MCNAPFCQPCLRAFIRRADCQAGSGELPVRCILDLAINPVVAVRVAAMDLPGFGHDETRVMHRHKFAARNSLETNLGE